MIVLADTSVWIRFLSNRDPYATELDALLRRDEVSGHDFVYGELLIGDQGGRKQLLADYEQMHQAPVVPHRDVVEFVRDRRLHGRGSVYTVAWLERVALSTTSGTVALLVVSVTSFAAIRGIDIWQRRELREVDLDELVDPPTLRLGLTE